MEAYEDMIQTSRAGELARTVCSILCHGPTLLALSHPFVLVRAEEIPSRGYRIYTAWDVEDKHTPGVSNLLEKWSWGPLNTTSVEDSVGMTV